MAPRTPVLPGQSASQQDAHETLAAIHALSTTRGRITPRDVRVLQGRETLARLLREEAAPPGLRVRQVTDLNELSSELQAMSQRTRREALSLHAGAVPTREMLEMSAAADIELMNRGGHMRVVYPSSFAQIDYVREFVEQQVAAGATYRFADAVPYRLIVSDGLRAVVPHMAGAEDSGAIITHEPVLVRALRDLAVAMLRRGVDLHDINPGAGGLEPTEMDRKVIRVLSLGLTDDAAAKRLCVSERTFRRHVTSVMERLGAVSRFQAGMRAVERGWL